MFAQEGETGDCSKNGVSWKTRHIFCFNYVAKFSKHHTRQTKVSQLACSSLGTAVVWGVAPAHTAN